MPVAGDPVQHELRLLTADGRRQAALEGIGDNPRPVYRGVAGRPVHRRRRVHSTTASRSTTRRCARRGQAVRRRSSPGARAGSRRSRSSQGEKLWLGKPTDTPEQGGVVLDLDRKVRTAAPPDDEKLEVDAPAGPVPKVLHARRQAKVPAALVATVGGAEKTIELPAGEVATAAAYLPAKPAMGREPRRGRRGRPGPRRIQRPCASDALRPRRRNCCTCSAGRRCAVRSLAFSGTRALLAGGRRRRHRGRLVAEKRLAPGPR